ncbi:hypothetical protein [Phaeobacter italicus]|uniref:hypothetical protein n=1 Tax=Phaeobacter italicus TaxID=481446 RepID=UPI00295EF0F5|nr:hypothetical protein [Phaeobacter italicus]
MKRSRRKARKTAVPGTLEQRTYFIAEEFYGGASFPIDTQQYQKLNSSLTAVVAALELEELFQVFAQSFLDFEEDLLTSSLAYAYTELHGEVEFRKFFSNVRRRFNVRIITILTAFQSYDDQTNRILSHAASLSSVLQVNTQTRTSTFDNNLSYRICAALRNYAQHRDLPLGGFSIGAKADFSQNDDGILNKDGFEYGVSPWLNLQKFRSSSQVKKDLRVELEKISAEKKDLKWLIRSFIAAVYNRHATLRESLKPIIISAQQDINTAYETANIEKGAEVKFLNLRGEGKSRPMRRDLAETVLKDFDTYTSLKNADRNYISSKIDQSPEVFAATKV